MKGAKEAEKRVKDYEWGKDLSVIQLELFYQFRDERRLEPSTQSGSVKFGSPLISIKVRYSTSLSLEKFAENSPVILFGEFIECRKDECRWNAFGPKSHYYFHPSPAVKQHFIVGKCSSIAGIREESPFLKRVENLLPVGGQNPPPAQLLLQISTAFLSPHAQGFEPLLRCLLAYLLPYHLAGIVFLQRGGFAGEKAEFPVSVSHKPHILETKIRSKRFQLRGI